MMNQSIERLNSLPRRAEETWQGGLIRLPARVREEGRQPYRPYLALWVAVRADLVHGGALLKPEERNLAAAVEALLAFACEDEFGGYRPGRVEVDDAELAEHLGELLAAADIEVRLVERLEAVQRVLDSMEAFREEEGPSIPSPLDGRGVTVERMRAFAEAAAAFYRATPWQHLTDSDVIRVEKPSSPKGMKHTVVMGAGRSVYGLAFYDSMAGYAAFRRAAAAGEDLLRADSDLWQFAFDPITDIPPLDADFWQVHDLPVAGANAYPVVLGYGSAGRIARPGSGRLLFLEGLLRALASTTEEEIDSGRWKKVVETSAGQKEFTLAMPDLLNPPSHTAWLKRGFTPDSRAHERVFADMDRFFSAHPADSVEEMSEQASKLFSGRSIDELVTPPETPREQAQELCYQGFSTHGRRRVQLARQALAVDPDCADAHVILAERAATLESTLEHYAKGVAAGERALGREAFERDAGHFWGITDTRPYMRARFGLAETLAELGRAEEAIEHYQALLRLNPNDNQGVRYLLLPKLMELGRDAEAARLLKEWNEQSAIWAYTQALLAFRLSGRSAAARRELRTAFRINPHVPELLTSSDPLPSPAHYSPGSIEEAVICAEELRAAYAETKGALRWLVAEQQFRERQRRRQKKRKRR